MEEHTEIVGIPVPSDDRFFLAFVILHILISMVAVVTGLFAMFTRKTSTRHKRSGNLYFWSMALAFITVVILSVMRWPHNIHLLIIGVLAFGTTYTGRKLVREHGAHRFRLHTICMGLSYIFLLTGFYVDNGKNLPFWRMFPQFFFYIFPSLIGIPVIIRVLLKHPLNKGSHR